MGHEKTDLGTKECVTNGQGSTWEEDEFSSFCFKRQFISPKIYVYYLEKLENTDIQEEEKKTNNHLTCCKVLMLPALGR